jgi:hypothetical protein
VCRPIMIIDPVDGLVRRKVQLLDLHNISQ